MNNTTLATTLKVLDKLVAEGVLYKLCDFVWLDVKRNAVRIDIEAINGCLPEDYMKNQEKYENDSFENVNIRFDTLFAIKSVNYYKDTVKTAFRSKIMRALKEIS